MEIAGSSPLARGLRNDVPVRDTGLRIIPARAGFTGSSPRTGVIHCGSSPLARGLQELCSTYADKGGIIPARAGFTVSRTGRFSHWPDHPRSRGVYAPHCRHAPVGKGSSPLARGLRAPAPTTATPRRIIPARAGFTGRPGRDAPPTSDHPRSRGVYFRPMSFIAFAAGSSPLARGLHHAGGAKSAGGGIIPARAGFTSSSR